MLTITSILIVLGLLFGGTGAAVYASQDSLPGDALYGVKTTVEDFQYRLILDEEAKLEKALERINNRIGEFTNAQGDTWTHRNQLSWTEELEQNIKDALLAVAALDDPEAGLIKLRTQVFMWEEDHKRLQDGMPDDAPAHQVWNVFRNTRMIVDDGLEDPLKFKANIASRFGQKLKELDLLLVSVDEEILPDDPLVTDETKGTQTKSSQQKGYGPDETQFGPGPNNAGEETPFEFLYKEGDEGGEGPAGSEVGNPESGGSGTPNQGGDTGPKKP